MKKIINIALNLLLNACLVLIALFLLKHLLLPAIIITLFISFFKRKVGNGFLNVSQYLRDVAYGIDQLGNVVCADLLNLTLIKYKKGGYRFGNPDETISSVLGKNYKLGTLTLIGKILDNILNLIDKNHSVNSIEKDE